MSLTEGGMSAPIRFCSLGGYRRWSAHWWKDLGRWLLRGWLWDVRTYWRRARYGWAPSDVWSLDIYLATVLGGSLAHMASRRHGVPAGYPDKDSLDVDFATWEADLTQWAAAFAAYAKDDYYEIHGTNYQAWHADEEARAAAVHQALKDMEPWFRALWI